MSKEEIVVLTFINLPKHLGGRQTGGLTMVNWQATEGINELISEVKVVLAATDFHKKSEVIGSTLVFGWYPRLLMRYAISHPLKTIWYGFQALKLKLNYMQPIFRNWAKLLFFDYSIKRVQPSIIQLRGIGSALLFEHLTGIKGVKKVLRLGGVNAFDPKIPQYKLWGRIEQRIALRRFDAVLFNSEGTRRDWQSYFGSVSAPSFVILNGFDPFVFHCALSKLESSCERKRSEDKEFRLLTIGSIQERKGQVRVVRAIGRLPNRKLFRYICAGAGSSEEIKNLRSTAASHNVRLELTGYLDMQELAKLIKSAHYMILPSTSEGFGSAYIESIACGTPVIIPKHLPLAQEPGVLNEKNAVIIDGPDEDSIRICLERLRPSRISREEIAETVSHLSRDKMGMRYIQIFKQVMEA